MPVILAEKNEGDGDVKDIWTESLSSNRQGIQ